MALIAYNKISIELMMELRTLFVVMLITAGSHTALCVYVLMQRELILVALHPGNGVQTKSVEQRVHNRLCGDKTFLVFPVPYTVLAFSFPFNSLPNFIASQLDLFSS